MKVVARSRLFREGAPFIAMSLVGRLLSILAVVVLARQVDAAQFGIFSYLQTTANLGLLIGLLNLPNILNVKLAHDNKETIRIENSFLIITTFITSIFASSIFIFILFFSNSNQLNSINELLSILLFIFTNAALSLLQAALFARGQFLVVAFSNLLISAAYFLVVCLAPLRTFADILLACALTNGIGVVIFAAKALGGGVIADVRVIGQAISRHSREWIRLLVTFSGATLITGIAFQYAMWLIQRSIIASGGPAENAIYAIGLQFTNVVIFLPSILAPVLVRTVTLSRAEGGKIRRVLAYFALSAVCCIAGLAAFWLLGDHIAALFPKSYAIDNRVLLISIGAGIFAFLKAPFSVYFQTRLEALPDSAGNVVAALATCVVAVFTPLAATALGGSELRALAWLIQLLLVGAFFAWRAVEPGGNLARPNGAS